MDIGYAAASMKSRFIVVLLLLAACKAVDLGETSGIGADGGLGDGSGVGSGTASFVPAAVVVDGDQGTWSVHFSPNGGCEDAVASFIATAKTSVHLMAYGFTSEKIANALIKKKAEGQGAIVVEVVLDKSDKTAKGSMAFMLRSGNVKVWIDSKHAIMHDKTIVVDALAFETGSFNFTNAAEHSNAENCLVEHDPAKAAAYDDNWLLHKGHSDLLPYE